MWSQSSRNLLRRTSFVLKNDNPVRTMKKQGAGPDALKERNKNRYWRFPKSNTSPRQNFDYFLVLDFEATCEENKKIDVQEIIEFPCIKVNAISLEPEAIFHQYVMPTVNPELSHFCTKLTGITQEMLEGQSNFKQTMQQFDQWLHEQGCANNRSTFVTCGDWDLKIQLPKQCQTEGIELPQYFTSWINIKHSFAEATSQFPRGIVDMMSRLNLKPLGRLHSGIDDCRNLTKVLQKLAYEGYVFHKTGFTWQRSGFAPSGQTQEPKS
ncbi:ERI1 exoribonuclease 3-like [Neocloeon triangulifer]|uniref:ERI1 exoribonuclease 3-like n=1 Tax=Neocloeon triangulifer TaxID=2078957 RepID=UPI00286F22F5|nr:ERI1 exoribonuclease 3-like [Neocloeon triangulifer]